MNPFILRSFLVFTQCCSMVRGRGSLRGHEQDSQHIDRSLIIGGEAATAGDYPYFVHFQPPGCGGTLIAPDIVLTAGHVSSKCYQRCCTIYTARGIFF
jgi:secreted trypsin-like serine protease